MTELRPPSDCQDMAMLRQQIDALDGQLLALLAVRAEYIDRAIALKQSIGWPARIPERVEEVVSNVRLTSGAVGLDPNLAETLWRPLIEWSIAREAQVIRET